MQILIKKDEHTILPREVQDLDEARAIAANGLEVQVIGADGVAVPLDDLAEPAETSEQAPAAKPAAKPAARKKR